MDLAAPVAEEAGLGKLTATGAGREALLTLEPDANLRAAYRPLLDGAKAHAKAKREARVRSYKPRAK